MNQPAHPEKDLYPSIQKLMESRDYEVICEFKTFSPLTGRTRKLDLLGFRWRADGDLDAWAVEGKRGASPADTLTALGQAIEYQLYVPRVSVAAEVPREELAFAENPLRQLGLGYIHATTTLTPATEVITPALSPRCYQNEFNQVVRHAGVLCLLGRERWKEEERGEHYSDGDISPETARYPLYCIHNTEPVQYMLTATGKSKKVQLGIWIDRKPIWKHIYRQIEPDRFTEFLANLNATTAIQIFKRDNFGRLGDCLEQRLLLPDRTAIANGLDYARKRLEGDRMVPVISVALELWAWEAMPRCAEAKKAVEETIARLEPTRAYLAAMSK